MTDEEIAQHAEKFAGRVSTTRRVNCEMYLGEVQYSTVTSVARAAFIAGAKIARDTMQEEVERLLEQVQLARGDGDDL